MIPNTPLRARRTNSRNETALDTARRTGRTADLMASEMINLTAGGGSCTEDDLRLYGFSSDEIDTLGPVARQEATRRYDRAA